LLVINAIFIAFTITYFYVPDFSQKWRLITPFSLHGENNIAVWWSGMTIFLAALLFYDRFRLPNDKNKTSWLFMAAIMLSLSIDEIGSIHERISLISGWSGLLPFALILASFLAYAIFNLYRSDDTKKNAIYILIAFSIYGSVALQEFFEHSYNWKPWMAGIRTGIEEGCELLATLLILLASITKSNTKKSLSILSLLPHQSTILNLKWMAVLGLVLHISGCFLFIKYGDPSTRGNPMIWFPSAAFFCIALLFASSNYKLDSKPINVLVVLAILFVTCSIELMTTASYYYIPKIGSLFNLSFIKENFLVFYVVLPLAVFIITFHKVRNKELSRFVYIPIIIGLAFFNFITQSLWLRYVILGVISYLTFLLCLSTVKNTIKLRY